MNIDNMLKELNETTKATFGADMSILIARAPAYGNDDFCFIVNGANRLPAAHALARILKEGKVREDSTPAWRGLPKKYYSIVEGSY